MVLAMEQLSGCVATGMLLLTFMSEGRARTTAFSLSGSGAWPTTPVGRFTC
jgi:hypothetical protein